MRKTQPEIPDPIECQGPDIKNNCLFHIDCAIFSLIAVFMVPEFCLINQLAITWHILLNKAVDIKDFIQPTSGKPDLDLVLISVYVLDTQHRFSLFFPPLMLFKFCSICFLSFYHSGLYRHYYFVATIIWLKSCYFLPTCYELLHE